MKYIYEIHLWVDTCDLKVNYIWISFITIYKALPSLVFAWAVVPVFPEVTRAVPGVEGLWRLTQLLDPWNQQSPCTQKLTTLCNFISLFIKN